MIGNYLKVALRKLYRNKLDSVISIGGLAVGIACCILLVAYVHFEWSYDDFHKKNDRIYRVLQKSIDKSNGKVNYSVTPEPLGPAIETNYPQVREVVRLTGGAMDVTIGGKFQTQLVIRSDPEFFEIFSFQMLYGDPVSALNSPGNVVITRSKARQIFDAEQVVGRTITARSGDESMELTVSGVMEDPPANSSISFEYLLPLDGSLLPVEEAYVNSWYVSSFEVFVLFRETADDVAGVQEDLSSYVTNQFNENVLGNRVLKMEFQPMGEIYLSPEKRSFLVETSSPLYSWILACVAFVVLSIAGINFMSLTLSRSAARSGEIGIRKMAGADRSVLSRQFLGEAFITCLLAFTTGALLSELAMPWFRELVGKPVTFSLLEEPVLWLILGGLLLLATLITGGYPAWVLSRIHISEAFSSHTYSSRIPAFVKGLIVAQFSLAIAFLASAFVMYSQMDYISNKDLGFRAENVLEVELSLTNPQKGGELFDSFSQEARKIPGVQSLTALFSSYGDNSFSSMIRSEELSTEFSVEVVDEHFLETMKIEVLQGKGFSDERPSEFTSGMLINRAAAEEWGWENPVGREFPESRYGTMYNGKTILGVVENYHSRTLMHQIEPLIFLHRNSQDGVARLMRIRISGAPLGRTVDQLQRLWDEMYPEETFTYSFLNDVVDRQYAFHERWKSIVELASGLAILLACFGLFGLAALAAQKRTKEVSIRKVLGATITHIVTLLSKDFVKLVALGFVTAVPVAYYAMDWWLADFAYKIEIGAGIFALAGGAALLIALATVSWQAVRAALANPVDSLRNE